MRHSLFLILVLGGLFALQACDKNEDKGTPEQTADSSAADNGPGDTGGNAESDCGAAVALADGACMVPDSSVLPDLPRADAASPDTAVVDVPAQDTAVDLAAPDVAKDVVADVVPDFPLEVGDKVPDFSLKAHDGTTFTLSAYAGKNVVISAFPAAKTAVCEWQTCWVNDHYEEFLALNTIPVGLSTDNLGKLALWAQEQSYKQLLLSDTNPIGAVSKMFGIFTESLFVTTRSLLVIDANGVLVYKKIFAMGANPDFDALMVFLKTLPQ